MNKCQHCGVQTFALFAIGSVRVCVNCRSAFTQMRREQDAYHLNVNPHYDHYSQINYYA